MKTLVCLLVCLFAGSAQAHLMVAQRGTLNLVDDGAYLVLSLPVSAFVGVDDDGDGALSPAELGRHEAAITAAITREVRLVGDDGPRPLQGLLLALGSSHEDPAAPATQIVAMGRFALDGQASLRLSVGLFGAAESEQTLQLTARQGDERQLLVLTPATPERPLFASTGAVFVSFVALGAEHITTGLDHLLFLLVVLAAGWRFRQVLVALTAFTVGHALTLALAVLGDVSVPPVIVEPAIAATIVAMAAFDLLRRQRAPSTALRLGLVFTCALIHGLGLASALTDLGLDSRHQAVSLAGFNVGIELAQLAIACLAALVALTIRHLWRPPALARFTHATALLAMVSGGVWFVQRLVVLA